MDQRNGTHCIQAPLSDVFKFSCFGEPEALSDHFFFGLKEFEYRAGKEARKFFHVKINGF